MLSALLIISKTYPYNKKKNHKEIDLDQTLFQMADLFLDVDFHKTFILLSLLSFRNNLCFKTLSYFTTKKVKNELLDINHHINFY